MTHTTEDTDLVRAQAEIRALREIIGQIAGRGAVPPSDWQNWPEQSAKALSEESRLALIGADDTVRQRVRERLQMWAALDSLRDGFAVFGSDGSLQASNRSFRMFFGDYVSFDGPVTDEMLIDAGLRSAALDTRLLDRDVMRALIKASMTTPQVLPISGGRRMRWTLRRCENGGAALLITDITDTVRRERDLDRARRQAEGAARTRTTFLASMSHEIRTPLNGVICMADLLAESGLNPDQCQMAETISGSGRALLTIVNNVLDFARGDATSIRLAHEPFDLELLLSEVVILIGRLSDVKGLRLIVDFDSTGPTFYRGDAGRLRQVLMNLLGNAVKFTQAGRIILGVTRNPRSGHLVISVSDSGVGIDDSDLDRIFVEFSQLDNGAASSPGGGTGLGLTITAQLIAAMGGQLWVHSVPGEGTVFGVNIPLLVEDYPLSVSDPPTYAGNVVAIAISDPAEAEATARRLRRHGLQILRANAETSFEHLVASDAVLCAPQDALPDTMLTKLRCVPDRPVLASMGVSGAEDTEYDLILPRFGPIYDMLLCQRKPLGQVMACPMPSPQLTVAQLPAAEPGQADDDFIDVLAADDNATNRLVLEKLLGRFALRLRSVENGELAVRAWQHQRPDLIFMDIAMPVMDGCDASRAIRRLASFAGHEHTPIVALTAHIDPEDHARILDAGIDAILQKPLTQHALMQEIDRWLPGRLCLSPRHVQNS